MRKIPVHEFSAELSRLLSRDQKIYSKAGWVSIALSIPFLIFLWPLGVLLFLGGIFCFYYAFKLKSGTFKSEKLLVLEKEHWIKFEPLEDSETPVQYNHYIIKTEDALKGKKDVYVPKSAFEIIQAQQSLQIYLSNADDLVAFVLAGQPFILTEEHILSDGSKRVISTSMHQTKRYLIGWEKV